MPDYSSIANVTQARAALSSTNTLETARGAVIRVYTSSNGNTTAADVRIYGQNYDLIQVTNITGIKLYIGAVVTVNTVSGNKHNYQITSFGSSGSSQIYANGTQATGTATNPTTNADVMSGLAPVVLWEASSAVENGEILTPGANIEFEYGDGSTGSGGGFNNGSLTVTMFMRTHYGISAVLALPSAATCGLSPETLAHVVNRSSGSLGGTPLGIFKLVGSGVGAFWQECDNEQGGGGSGATIYFNQNCTGSGTAWALPRVPTVGVVVVADGIMLKPTTDYTISGANITLVRAALTWVMGAVLQ